MNRQTLLAALFYPRFHLRNNLMQRDCPLDNHFREDAQACGACLYQDECRWLGNVETDPHLQDRSTAELVRTLAFAVHYIDADVAYWGHDPRQCHCEACQWLREAQQEIQQVEAVWH